MQTNSQARTHVRAYTHTHTHTHTHTSWWRMILALRTYFVVIFQELVAEDIAYTCSNNNLQRRGPHTNPRASIPLHLPLPALFASPSRFLHPLPLLLAPPSLPSPSPPSSSIRILLSLSPPPPPPPCPSPLHLPFPALFVSPSCFHHPIPHLLAPPSSVSHMCTC